MGMAVSRYLQRLHHHQISSTLMQHRPTHLCRGSPLYVWSVEIAIHMHIVLLSLCSPILQSLQLQGIRV